jgi:galactose mutarotase-like enzyme
VETKAGRTKIPDHGDLWRVAWEPVAINGSVKLRGKCFSLPLELERTVTLSGDGVGWRLGLDYKLTNTGIHSAPWSWSAQPFFAAQAGDQILLPGSIASLRLEGSGGRRLGVAGNSVAWPIAALTSGSWADLSVTQPPESGIGDKLFAGPLTATEDWCALARPSAGMRIRMRFDPAATPYLGLWICHGGWPKRPGPKQACVAFEPTTAPVDSLAQTGPWSRELAPGESFSWPMVVEIESI